MKVDKFMKLLTDSGQRTHFIGGSDFGAVAALDREGRIFTVIEGEVVSRVNAEALTNISTRDAYCNPGGDVLWPAPEGTCFGYEYSTGKWRVPPGITGARYIARLRGECSAVIQAEIDLINDMGIGLPCLFERNIELNCGERRMKVSESITYLGRQKIGRENFLIAPWSLSQFDNSPDAEVVFPHVQGTIRDLYEASDSQRHVEKELCRSKTNSSLGYQIAISGEIEWIEYRDPARNLSVRRTAGRIPAGLEYIDIADAPPADKPHTEGVRFSVYNDKSGFMEIEAAGGCPPVLQNGVSTSVEVYTQFNKLVY